MIRSNGYATISATIKHVNRKNQKKMIVMQEYATQKKCSALQREKKSNAVKM